MSPPAPTDKMSIKKFVRQWQHLWNINRQEKLFPPALARVKEETSTAYEQLDALIGVENLSSLSHLLDSNEVPSAADARLIEKAQRKITLFLRFLDKLGDIDEFIASHHDPEPNSPSRYEWRQRLHSKIHIHFTKISTIFSPIRRVPTEIWIEIFTYHSHSMFDIIAFCTVCRQWCHAAIDSSHLWTNFPLKISFDPTHADIVGYLLPVLRFSGQRPLDMAISYESVPLSNASSVAAITSSIPDKHRWKTLRTGPSCIQALFHKSSQTHTQGVTWDMLETITIEQKVRAELALEDISFASAPCLRHLAVAITGRFSVGQVTALPWAQLVSLILYANCSTTEDYLLVLKQCPNLTTCMMFQNFPQYAPLGVDLALLSPERLLLPKMRFFTLQVCATPTAILRLLDFPNLEKLTVAIRNTPPDIPGPLGVTGLSHIHSTIYKFIEAWGCKLSVFEYRTPEMPYNRLP